MGSSYSGLGEMEVLDLEEKTGFSQEQIITLHKRFKILTQDKDILRKEDLENIGDLNFNPIRKEIIHAFFDKRNLGHNGVGTVVEINFKDFLVVMSHFRPLNQDLTEEERQKVRKEKLRFIFNMHDVDNDGIIALDEYRTLVEELLSNSSIEPETAKEVADAAMLEVASVTMGEMAPDEIYEGITFEHFLQILKGLEIEAKMHIRFPYMDTTPMNC